MADFTPGLALAKDFYHTVVAPIMTATAPGLAYSAALIGSGSEVLGFDTTMSTDHDWGPRVMIFLHEEEYATRQPGIVTALHTNLPHNFRGYPVFTTPAKDRPDDEPKEEQLTHRVELWTIPRFFHLYLGVDITQPLVPVDWLSLPQQKLRATTVGALFHDEVGLQATRHRLSWYPRDVWLYLLAAGWTRIGQEEHLMGRAGLVGDEIGSSLIANRLVRDLMMLCFLMERQYAPYPKWFGTAFAQLACAADLSPLLRATQHATTWQEREPYLTAAYTYVATMHNALGVTPPISTATDFFFTRPFQVIWGARFAEALCAQITDPDVQHLVQQRLIGSVDQISDNTDLLSDARWRRGIANLYTSW